MALASSVWPLLLAPATKPKWLGTETNKKKPEICFPATSDACVRTTWLVFMAIGDFFAPCFLLFEGVWGVLKGATEILLEEEKEVGERKKPFPGRHNSQEQPHSKLFFILRSVSPATPLDQTNFAPQNSLERFPPLALYEQRLNSFQQKPKGGFLTYLAHG